jgi:hypothetical protein
LLRHADQPQWDAIGFSTYLGGSDIDQPYGLAFDGQNNVYVSGLTGSANFPVTANAYQKNFAGGVNDAFLTKLSADGSKILYSTYFGGPSQEQGQGLAVTSGGKAYIVLNTNGIGTPTTAGAYQPAFDNSIDAFLAVIDTTKTGAAGLDYGTYLGGSDFDQAFNVDIDSSGHAYLTGETQSTNWPVTPGAYQTVKSGGFDVFLSVINPAGKGKSDLVYSTYLGGSGDELATSIAVSNGQAYISGSTASNDFPVSANGFQKKCGGNGLCSSSVHDAFVARIHPAGAGKADLVFSTYLGGSGDENPFGIDVDNSGNVYVSGRTASTDFPLHNPLQSTYGGGAYDAFVAMLNSSGSALRFSTYFGGNGFDGFNGVVSDGNGGIWLGGRAGSDNIPVTAGAVQSRKAMDGGQLDALLVHIDLPAILEASLGTATRLSPTEVSVPLILADDGALPADAVTMTSVSVSLKTGTGSVGYLDPILPHLAGNLAGGHGRTVRLVLSASKTVTAIHVNAAGVYLDRTGLHSFTLSKDVTIP